MGTGLRMGAINIICRDLARSLHFYSALLGFTLVERQETFAHLRLGERDLTLLAVATEPAPPAVYCRQPGVSWDLYCEDLAAELARLLPAGVTLAPGHAVTSKRAFLCDPDGLVIELIQHR